MAALGNYCYRELTAVGVKVVKPTGGYYAMPDFEVIRPALASRGVKTGQQMCDLIFEETSVTVSDLHTRFADNIDVIITCVAVTSWT
jgi:aspartate/methionine/tyrosine aminotransferase